MGKLFGTDGIRAIADQYPINSEMGQRLGYSIVRFCKSQNISPSIIIGRDTRASGKMLEYALVFGILSEGGIPHLAGVIPTPGVAFLTKHLGVGAGIVISASHNPHEYNGFKIFSHNGFKLSEDEELEIEDMILEGIGPLSGGISAQVEVIKDANDRYISFLMKSIPDQLPNTKTILDCANGATFRVAPALFKRLGLDTEAMFVEPDGRNINKHCGSEYTEELSNRVIETRADIGLAFDGDGDRLIVVDEKGCMLTGDQVLIICAKMLRDRGELKNNIVVSTVMSNMGFRSALNDLGIKMVATEVGDRHVVEEMKRENGCLGGEASGHIIFSDHHTTGDGILTALQLIYAIGMFNQPLSELSNLMEIYPQTLINVPVKIKPDISQIPELVSVIKNVEAELRDDGRVLVRYSGTEPICRVLVEGKKLEDVERHAHKIADLINKKLNN